VAPGRQASFDRGGSNGCIKEVGGSKPLLLMYIGVKTPSALDVSNLRSSERYEM